MRIAFLASIYPRASDSYVRNEVIQLRELGHEVVPFAIRKAHLDELLTPFHREERARTTYLYSDRKWRLPFAALGLLASDPGRFVRGLALAWSSAPNGVAAAARQLAYFLEACVLARELRRRGVEHLHNHVGENSASVAMLASELSGVPYSMTIHGPYIFRAPEQWALGEKIQRSAFTVCITEFARSQCLIHTPFAQWQKLHIVHCAPDIAFLETPPEPLPEAPRFVWVGRLCEEKAVPLVIDAAKHLADAGEEFEIAMIGDGPLRAEAEAMIRGYGLEERVKLLGWRSADEVAKQIVDARVMLLPSFAEGLPIVLMEALAMARPCITTAIAGIPELVKHGENGWLVPAGSTHALVEAMREALATPAERLTEMGANGRSAVRERHHPRTEAQRLAGLIEAYAAERGAN